MLAKFKRLQADGSVHVVRNGDVDGINVAGFLFQQFTPVLIALHVRPFLLHSGEIARINIAHGRQLPLGMIGHGGDVRPGHARGAKGGMAQFSVR